MKIFSDITKKMSLFLGVNFNSEEIPIQHNNNVYTDGEFNVKIPNHSRLIFMPNMTWTRVWHNIILLHSYLHYYCAFINHLHVMFISFFRQKHQVNFDSTNFIWILINSALRSSTGIHTSLLTKGYQKKLYIKLYHTYPFRI